MRATSAAALVFCAFSALSAAAAQPPSVPAPQASQLINLNLMEALVAISAEDLAGVFSFVPEGSAAPALADFLAHNRYALKRFVKKNERDLKEVGAVNEWDKQVLLYVLQLNGSTPMPPGIEKLPARWENRVSALAISPALSLAEMTARRSKR